MSNTEDGIRLKWLTEKHQFLLSHADAQPTSNIGELIESTLALYGEEAPKVARNSKA